MISPQIYFIFIPVTDMNSTSKRMSFISRAELQRLVSLSERWRNSQESDDPERILEALDKDPEIINMISERLAQDRDLIMRALSRNKACGRWLPLPMAEDPIVLRRCLDNDGPQVIPSDLTQGSIRDKDLAMIMIRYNPARGLEAIGPNIDIDLAMLAVTSDYTAYHSLPRELKIHPTLASVYYSLSGNTLSMFFPGALDNL